MEMKLSANSKAIVTMLLVQAFAMGMQLLSRIILNNGTFIFALMTYRHMVASICVAPIALYFERGFISKLNWRVGIFIFLNALVGITLAMSLYYYGLRDTTATYAANFLNLIPIVTFVLSILARIEPFTLKSKGGQLMIIGSLLCVAGALTTGLYTGKSFYLTGDHHVSHSGSPQKAFETNYAIGTVMLIGSCISYAVWYLLQVKLIKVCPSRYWTTLLTCIMASVQSMVVGVIIDRRKASWNLNWDLTLITIVYSGTLSTAATFCLVSFAVAARGPTFPPMFNPLTLVSVSILEGLLLGAQLNTGGVIGSILIVIGIYAFLWGKRTEMEKPPRPPVGDVETGILESATIQQTNVEKPAEGAGSHHKAVIQVSPETYH